jgi:hypothetical protein
MERALAKYRSSIDRANVVTVPGPAPELNPNSGETAVVAVRADDAGAATIPAAISNAA